MTVKFADAVEAAKAKSTAIEANIQSLTNEKAIVDQFLAEAAQLSPASVELLDTIAVNLAAATAVETP
jgi:hypothetical protein